METEIKVQLPVIDVHIDSNLEMQAMKDELDRLNIDFMRVSTDSST